MMPQTVNTLTITISIILRREGVIFEERIENVFNISILINMIPNITITVNNHSIMPENYRVSINL